jgi:hypothetical protein
VVRDPNDDVEGEAGGDHAEVQGEHETHGAGAMPGFRRAPTREGSTTEVAMPPRGVKKGYSPTRDELYEQARQLGIEGRSKMNKQQLARAVGRKAK